eukprot:127937-Hanusia_phi.AAC.6
MGSCRGEGAANREHVRIVMMSRRMDICGRSGARKCPSESGQSRENGALSTRSQYMRRLRG